MALSRLASDFAAEINYHDWSDAPFRMDRAGHRRELDGYTSTPPLSDQQTESVRTNVMWVVAQVLGHYDPNLDPYEFAQACGVNTHTPSGRPRSGHITAGLRHDLAGRLAGPVVPARCYVCSRSVAPGRDGKVQREGITTERPPGGWVWGPVVVHDDCRLELTTPLDDLVGDGQFVSTGERVSP